MRSDFYYLWMFLFLLLVSGVSCALKRDLDEFLANPDIATPELARIQDGTYTGEKKAGPIFVRVEVAVKEHTITHCKILKHRCGRGKPANTIVDSVLHKQSLEIDAVSGATFSSKVILKAIQMALER
ncbi:FMN-binding protein [bacterium]|nr:FMN-binding protein [bacterium]